MAAVAPATKDNTELMAKLTLDAKTKALDAPEGAKKSTANQSRGRHPANKVQKYKDSNNMCYLSNGYAPSAYYYGGYNGPTNAWENYSSYVNTDGTEMPPPGVYGDMYHHGYGYAPYGAYPSPGTVPATGQDGQLYSPQYYQYPATYYHQQTRPNAPSVPNRGGAESKDKVLTSAAADQPSIAVDDITAAPNGSVNVKANENVAHNKWVTPAKNQNLRSLPHLMAETPTGVWNRMYLDNRMYAQCGNAFRSGLGIGPNFYGSQSNGCWGVPVNTNYRPRGRGNGFSGYGNENFVGLGELNRGPRVGFSGNQKGFESGTGASVGKGQNLSEDSSEVLEKDQFNQPDFPEMYADAKFYVIKSYSEDDVHKSIKYNVWASTPNGNKKLDAAYQESQKPGGCPVFLFFSVNTSGQFVGMAEMVGPVDFDKTVDYWHQDKWTGCFPLKWHIVKDVPNSILRHITLENNDGKPVTNSRDTQEVKLEQGLQMLKIFKEHVAKTSVLDDFGFYEIRQRAMQERRAKQKQLQEQIANGKLIKGNDGATGKPRSQSPLQSFTLEKKEAQLVTLEKKEAPKVCLSKVDAI